MAAEIAGAAARLYDLPAGIGARMINHSENATYCLEAPDQRRWALRIHRQGYHTRAAIASELDWVKAIRRDTAVSTPAPLPGRDGELVQNLPMPDGGLRHAVLFQWEDGCEPPDHDLSKTFAQLGAIAARLHLQARQYRRAPWFERLTWDFAGAFGPHAHWGQWRDGLGMDAALRPLFARALEVMKRRLQRFGRGRERFGLAHCDMRLANLLIDGDAIKVIDFDDCGFSWFLYDCAAALSFFEHRADVPELIAAWVEGYRKVADLPAEDAAEIPTFVLFRRLLLIAWIGSRKETALARSMGVAYTQSAAGLAEDYLSRFGN